MCESNSRFSGERWHALSAVKCVSGEGHRAISHQPLTRPSYARAPSPRHQGVYARLRRALGARERKLPLPPLRHVLDLAGIELVDVLDQVVGDEIGGRGLFL